MATTLFDRPNHTPPRARSTDPASSHEAAHDVQRRGILRKQGEIVLEFVRTHPGKTACELAEIAKLANREDVDRTIFGRRLPDLAKAEQIYRGAERKCRIKNRTMLTWWPCLRRSSEGCS